MILVLHNHHEKLLNDYLFFCYSVSFLLVNLECHTNKEYPQAVKEVGGNEQMQNNEIKKNQ